MKELIAHKKGVFPKTILKVTNKYGIPFIVKVSKRSLYHEIRMYEKMRELMISNFFAEIYKCDKKKNKYICFHEYIEYSIHKFYEKIINKKEREIFWKRLFIQLIYVIAILEKNKIQHNDFHLGNLMISGCDARDFNIKIIDLETMADYKNKNIPKEIIQASSKEKKRLGWSNKFHPGSDLNQMLGELIENYEKEIPKKLVKLIKPLIIEDKTKEFPFTITKSNEKTSGKNLIKVIMKE